MVQKQYAMEKFKEGFSGRNFVVEEPEFKFEAPKFKRKLKLPKASKDPGAAGYLTARKLNPDDFYFAEHFKKFANSLKPTFESEDYDEERIIIPLYYEKNLIGFQGRSLGPSKVKYITVMLDDDAPKIYGLDNIRRDAPVYITEGPFDSTFIPTRLLCAELTLILVVGGLATLCGFMITNHETERLQTEYPKQSILVSR